MTTEYTDNFRLNLPDFRMGPWHDLVNENMLTIDEILNALYQGVDTVVWANSTLYNPGTSAIDPADGTFWVCCVSHTSAATGTFAADRAAYPTYWNRVLVGLSPRGPWAHDTHYLPNDLVTESASGIIAICITDHISNHSGTIRNDSAYWTFLVDLASDPVMAVEVTYDNSVTHITPTNVQAAIDLLIARGGTLGEAPTDGQVYGRQNAAWTSVGLPATNFPIMDSVAAVGASAKYAREDHVHPSDTTKASITYVDSGDTAVAGIAANKVAKAGDTMSGPLVLYADPANPGEAATKHYVDMSSGGAAPATAAPIMDSVATVGVATKYAREDHIHPSDTTKAPLASPALTGNPTVPTQAANDNSTKAASTAYVDAKEATANPVMNGAVAIGVSHLLARQDHVHASDTSRLGVAGGQTTTGGFRITPYSGGTVSSGTYTPDAFNHNYQYYTNNGAHTLAAPANDCAIDILITNGATAGAITFTGFTVGTTGDALTTVNASKFIVSVRRINAIATYTIKALQ